MKWVIDITGRFRWRPYYDQEELDYECEQIVSSFLKRRYGESRFPLSTDDLSVMIEQDTSDLDLYADLSAEGKDVEGLTEFFPNKKPAVKVVRELSLYSWGYNRLRTTLAHEYGHVKFHTFLWDFGLSKKPSLKVARQLSSQRWRYNRLRAMLAYEYSQDNLHLFSRNIDKVRPHTDFGLDSGFRCKRSRILDAPFSDWMEWQASYVCGAILMPLSLLRDCIRTSLGEWCLHNWLPGDSDSARELVVGVAESFDVSTEAARVRLEKLGFLQNIHLPSALPSNKAFSHVSL